MQLIRHCFFGVLLLASLGTNAQQNLQFLNHWGNQESEAEIVRSDSTVHTSARPMLEWKAAPRVKSKEFYAGSEYGSYSWFRRKLWHEHLVDIQRPDAEMPFHFTIDPLFRFEGGNDSEDTSDVFLRKNTRGFLVRGSIGQQVTFESSFYENQSFLPTYQREFANRTGVIPGSGRHKVFQETGFDYSMSSGLISYTPNTHFNFRFGHGKNFIGDGYRSLLLSDNAFNYPFFRSGITFGKGKFQYTSIWAWLQSVNRVPRSSTPEASFQRKAGSFHYLNWMPHRRLAIGLFEGVMWQRWDSTGTTDFDANFVNPVIGANTLVHGLDDPQVNAIIGLNLKVLPLNWLQVYGQWMMDESSETGYQGGLRLLEPVGVEGLFLQAEWNSVAGQAYDNALPLQRFDHYNQPLAHPQGGGFREVLVKANYRYKRMFTRVQYTNVRQEFDADGVQVGQNPVVADFTILPATTRTIRYTSVEIGYLVNPATNMHLALGMVNRDLESGSGTSDQSTRMVYLTWSTALRNIYYDF
ncbi:MAG: hypothetical protein ACFB10_24000 [Salibacteraceae bacterium]